MTTVERRAVPENWDVLVDYVEDRIDLADAHVLDVGCGTGGITEALSEHCRAITTCDINPAAVERGLGKSACADTTGCQVDAASLPFEADTFDIAIVNGVLEWVPEASDDNPKVRQLTALRELARVLRSGGLLYLGIETRFYAPYLAGLPDHSDLRFAAVMPRPLANLYSKVVRDREYRNYLYSVTGYRRLLRATGYGDIEPAAALPTYKLPQAIIPFDRMDEIRRAIPEIDEPKWRKPIRRLLAVDRRLFELFGTEVVITARVE